jgi:hypothetical protein
MHVFIYEPNGLYRFGQKLLADIFRFFAPLVKVAPFVLPIYSILFLVIFYFVSLVFTYEWVGNSCMFWVSFSLTMHLVFTAKNLRDSDKNAVKPHYLFSMSLIYVLDIFILALILDLVVSPFSFPEFFKSMTHTAEGIYTGIFRQLFFS